MEEQDSTEFIYQTIKEKVDLAFQDVEHVDTKAGVLIGFNGIIISLALSVVERCNVNLFYLAIILFLASIGSNFKTFKIRKYRRDPNPRLFAEKYWDKSKREMQEQLVTNLIECYEVNVEILNASARWINYSLFLTLFGLVFLIASTVKN